MYPMKFVIIATALCVFASALTYPHLAFSDPSMETLQSSEAPPPQARRINDSVAPTAVMPHAIDSGPAKRISNPTLHAPARDDERARAQAQDRELVARRTRAARKTGLCAGLFAAFLGLFALWCMILA